MINQCSIDIIENSIYFSGPPLEVMYRAKVYQSVKILNTTYNWQPLIFLSCKLEINKTISSYDCALKQNHANQVLP